MNSTSSILEILSNHKKRKRITAVEIKNNTNISPVRLREIVSNLRSNGTPIGSDKKGYFLATTPKEIQATIQHLTSRKHKLNSCIEGLSNWCNDYNKKKTIQ